MNVEHVLCHIFRPFISVHFRNLFFSHIAFMLKTDTKKPCLQQIHARCPWKYESSRWKCLMLVIGRFRIRHTTFRWFSKMYFRFPSHHVDISSRDMTELYTAINSTRSSGQCPNSAWPYYSFGDTEIKVDWEKFCLPLAGIRVNKTSRYCQKYYLVKVGYKSV